MKQVLSELWVGKSLIRLLEAMIFAIVWFFVLRTFSDLDANSISFAIGTIYILWIVVGNALLYLVIYLSNATRALMKATLVILGREDIAPRPKPQLNAQWVVMAVFGFLLLIMATQGPAVLAAHLLMSLLGKPALSEGIRNFAIGLTLVGNLVIVVPTVAIWGTAKWIHSQVLQHEMAECESCRDEGFGQWASKLSALRIPMPSRGVQWLPASVVSVVPTLAPGSEGELMPA